VGVSELASLWPVGVVVVIVGGVVVAFLHCAVAEGVMRLAAWVLTPDPVERAERVEEWSRILEDAAANERPAHAATFLWQAVRHLPDRRRSKQPERAVPERTVRAFGAQFSSDVVTVRIIRKGMTKAELVNPENVWVGSVWAAERLIAKAPDDVVSVLITEADPVGRRNLLNYRPSTAPDPARDT
jgi:hypothetical protein